MADDETTRSLPVSATPSGTGSSGTANHEQIVRMVVKLFGMYPVGAKQNLDLAIEGYVEALVDLPWKWVSVAIGELVKDKELTFAPPVGRIRHETARQYMRSYRRAQGKDPDRNETMQLIEVTKPERWLSMMREQAGLPEPATVAPLELPENVRALVDRVGKDG